jgi:hypothetical protein
MLLIDICFRPYTVIPLCLCRWWLFSGKLVYVRAWIMVEAIKGPRLHPISILYYNLYTKCLSTLVCCGWTYGCIPNMWHLCRWGWIFEKLGYDGVSLNGYCSLMVEATKVPRLYPISILYVCKVFEHLGMVWMDIWVHPSDVTPMQVGVNCCWKIGVCASPNGIVVWWLRLPRVPDYIPHTYIAWYTKWFSTLVWCGWTFGCTTLGMLHLCRWRWGWIVGKNSSIHSMHTMCFSTLVSCWWPYWCTLGMLHQCRWGWVVGKLGSKQTWMVF